MIYIRRSPPRWYPQSKFHSADLRTLRTHIPSRRMHNYRYQLSSRTYQCDPHEVYNYAHGNGTPVTDRSRAHATYIGAYSDPPSQHPPMPVRSRPTVPAYFTPSPSVSASSSSSAGHSLNHSHSVSPPLRRLVSAPEPVVETVSRQLLDSSHLPPVNKMKHYATTLPRDQGPLATAHNPRSMPGYTNERDLLNALIADAEDKLIASNFDAFFSRLVRLRTQSRRSPSSTQPQPSPRVGSSNFDDDSTTGLEKREQITLALMDSMAAFFRRGRLALAADEDARASAEAEATAAGQPSGITATDLAREGLEAFLLGDWPSRGGGGRRARVVRETREVDAQRQRRARGPDEGRLTPEFKEDWQEEEDRDGEEHRDEDRHQSGHRTQDRNQSGHPSGHRTRDRNRDRTEQYPSQSASAASAAQRSQQYRHHNQNQTQTQTQTQNRHRSPQQPRPATAPRRSTGPTMGPSAAGPGPRPPTGMGIGLGVGISSEPLWNDWPHLPDEAQYSTRRRREEMERWE